MLEFRLEYRRKICQNFELLGVKITKVCVKRKKKKNQNLKEGRSKSILILNPILESESKLKFIV